MRKHLPSGLAVLLALSTSVAAQSQTSQGECPDGMRWSRGEARHCEVREYTLPATGAPLEIDARPNGGIHVTGSARPDILVRARVMTQGATAAEASQLAAQVQVHASGSQVRSEGPQNGRDGVGWQVSYEVLVPTHTSLELRSTNGGVSVADVEGRIDAETVNGGVRLARVGGHVRGRTSNGGVEVSLDGQTWTGEGLDVQTRNGGIRLAVPEGYSARLETGTVNGSLRVDFPLTLNAGTHVGRAGRLSRELQVDLGAGGPLLRLRTTNGGIRLTTARP